MKPRFWVILNLVTLLFTTGMILALVNQSSSASLHPATNKNFATHFSYLEYTKPQDSVIIFAHPFNPTGTLVLDSTPAHLLTHSLSPDCDIDQAAASPTGQTIALSFNCEDNAHILLYNPNLPHAQPRSFSQGYFLDWSTDGSWFLFRQIERDQVWLVSTDQDTVIPLALPEKTHHAAFTPDNRHVAYAASRGSGWGSELGVFHLDDESYTVWQTYADKIVVYPRFSPDGQKLAYLLIPDNNVPFTVGELWVADPAQQSFTLLDNQADAGHGFPPVWRPDSSSVTYVRREPSTPPQADQNAFLLHSNIYEADPLTRKRTPLTHFSGAMVYDIVWSGNGKQLAFTAQDAIWILTPGHVPTRITSDNVLARHPLWLSLGK